MEQKTIISIIAGVALVGGGVWAATTYFQPDTTVSDPVEIGEEQDAIDEQDQRFAHIDRISAVHFFDDGSHTFAGEIDMPTPCDLLEVDAVVMESFPEQIRLEFSVISEDTDLCAQVITPQRFMVQVDASEEATVTAELMGRSVELNLREAQPGETPDDFELFIKG